MVAERKDFGEVNVLASGSDWAWPRALNDIFRPRGVNLLMANSTLEFESILHQRRIQTTIIDMDSEAGGLATVKIIRRRYPLLPCILLASRMEQSLLGEALRLEVFSVIDKPVDMALLLEQLNKLFLKKYNSGVFAK